MNLAAIKMSPYILAQLPAWYHITAEQQSLNKATAKCLIQNHKVTKVADLVKSSARLRHPPQHPDHQHSQECLCQDCLDNRTRGCEHPHNCATEALIRLNLILPKYNQTLQGIEDGLSLTRSRQEAKKPNSKTKQW